MSPFSQYLISLATVAAVGTTPGSATAAALGVPAFEVLVQYSAGAPGQPDVQASLPDQGNWSGPVMVPIGGRGSTAAYRTMTFMSLCSAKRVDTNLVRTGLKIDIAIHDADQDSVSLEFKAQSQTIDSLNRAASQECFLGADNEVLQPLVSTRTYFESSVRVPSDGLPISVHLLDGSTLLLAARGPIPPKTESR